MVNIIVTLKNSKINVDVLVAIISIFCLFTRQVFKMADATAATEEFICSKDAEIMLIEKGILLKRMQFLQHSESFYANPWTKFLS